MSGAVNIVMLTGVEDVGIIMISLVVKIMDVHGKQIVGEAGARILQINAGALQVRAHVLQLVKPAVLG